MAHPRKDGETPRVPPASAGDGLTCPPVHQSDKTRENVICGIQKPYHGLLLKSTYPHEYHCEASENEARRGHP